MPRYIWLSTPTERWMSGMSVMDTMEAFELQQPPPRPTNNAADSSSSSCADHSNLTLWQNIKLLYRRNRIIKLYLRVVVVLLFATAATVVAVFVIQNNRNNNTSSSPRRRPQWPPRILVNHHPKTSLNQRRPNLRPLRHLCLHLRRWNHHRNDS